MDKIDYIKLEDGRQIRVIWGETGKSIFESSGLKKKGPVVLVSEPIPVLVNGQLMEVTIVLGRSRTLVYKMAVVAGENAKLLGDIIRTAAKAAGKS